MEPREHLSLSDSDLLRVRLHDGPPIVACVPAAVAEAFNCWLARMVSPFDSQSSESSSSARLAKTSGSSSSGGNIDIQHMRDGSNIMFPTLRAPAVNEFTGDPIDEPVRWVIRAGLVDVPTVASKSRKTWSLPSHRSVCGFHFISPTTATDQHAIGKANDND